jgi:hypothetical protein
MPPSVNGQQQQGEGVPVVTDELTQQLKALFEGMVGPRGPQDTTEDLRNALETAVRDVAGKPASSNLNRSTSASATQQPGPVLDVEPQQPSNAAADAAARPGGGAESVPLSGAAADTADILDIDPVLDGVVQQLDPASLSSDFVFGPLPGDLAQQPKTTVVEKSVTHSSSSSSSTTTINDQAQQPQTSVKEKSVTNSSGSTTTTDSRDRDGSSTSNVSSSGAVASRDLMGAAATRRRQQSAQTVSVDQRAEEVAQLMMELQEAKERCVRVQNITVPVQYSTVQYSTVQYRTEQDTTSTVWAQSPEHASDLVAWFLGWLLSQDTTSTVQYRSNTA